MQAVKDLSGWKINQEKQVTSEAFVEIEFNITDPDLAKTDAEIDKNNETTQSISQEHRKEVFSVDDETILTCYGTLEPDRWRLDGSMTTAPELDSECEYCGWISRKICDANGKFAESEEESGAIASISVSDDVVKILPGITITWDVADGEYAKEFKITAMSKGAPIENGTETFIGESTETAVSFQMQKFDQIVIEVLEWSAPWRRARIGKIYMGVNKVYGKTELLKFSCSQNVDPLSAGLPKYEVLFEVDNRDGTFNPLKEDGLSKAMMERQQIRVWYGFKLGEKTERIPGGVYYLTEWTAPQNGRTATFKARDLLEFFGADYTLPQSNLDNLSAMAIEVLTQADFPDKDLLTQEEKSSTNNELWYIHSCLEEITTTASMPEKCTLAECLQLIANAAGCAIFFDRTGKLHIAPFEPEKNTLQCNCDGCNMCTCGDASDACECEREYVSIDCDKSYTKPEISLLKPTKEVKVSYYLQGEEAGTAVVPEDAVGSGESIHLKDNVLISTENDAQRVAENLMAYLQQRKRIEIDWRIDPRMDVGDIVNISGQENCSMRLLSYNLSFSGAFKGKCEGAAIEGGDV